MICGALDLDLDLCDRVEDVGGGDHTVPGSSKGGDSDIRSIALVLAGFEDVGGGSMTSWESMKVGGLCSSKQSATCHIPTVVRVVDVGKRR